MDVVYTSILIYEVALRPFQTGDVRYPKMGDAAF
jgi:hypothetical protein